VLPLPL
jgi:hypothetical protein